MALKPPTKLAYGAHAYGPGVRLLPYMREEEFPENIEQVWEEHFLYLRRVTGRAVVLHLGGPYESSKRDRDWQDWAVRHAAREGISLFYDSLNPASGRGGDAPSDPVVEGADGRDAAPSSAAASGGLLHADWRTPWTDKLHLLAQLPATRVTSLLDLSHGGTARAAPPPPIASPPSVYPDWLRPPPPSPPPPVPMDAASILLPMAAFAMLVGVGAARAGLLRGRLAGLRACVASSRLLPSPLKRCLGGVFAWLRLADADASVLPTLEEAESAVNGGTALVPRARGKGKARKEEEGSLVPRAKGKGTRRRGFVEDDVGDDDEEPDGSEFLVDAEDEEAPPPSSIVPAKKGRAARKEKEARERQPLTRAPSPPPPAASSSKRSSKAAAGGSGGARRRGGGRRRRAAQEGEQQQQAADDQTRLHQPARGHGGRRGGPAAGAEEQEAAGARRLWVRQRPALSATAQGQTPRLRRLATRPAHSLFTAASRMTSPEGITGRTIAIVTVLRSRPPRPHSGLQNCPSAPRHQ